MSDTALFVLVVALLRELREADTAKPATFADLHPQDVAEIMLFCNMNGLITRTIKAGTVAPKTIYSLQLKGRDFLALLPIERSKHFARMLLECRA